MKPSKKLRTKYAERLQRLAKSGEVYLKDYQMVPEEQAHLSADCEFYIDERSHDVLGYRTPDIVYLETRATLAPALEALVQHGSNRDIRS